MRGDAWHASSASKAVDGSRRRLLVTLGLSLVLVAACQSTLPDGVFTCQTDSDCPQKMHCSPDSYLCFRILDTSTQMPAVTAAGSGASTPGPSAGSAAGAGGKAAIPPIAVGSAGASGAAAGSGSTAAGSGGSTPAPGAPLCANGELACGEFCVPSDAQNCGSCGHNCRSLPHVSGPVTCSGPGKCGFPASSCAPGWANCSNDPETGCETDITAPSDCGGCGVKCPAATPVCAASGCSSGCPTQTPNLCNGACVDNQASANHCGTCGNKCTTSVAHAEPVCERGSCGFECNSGFMECNGACVDLKTDAANCGACGMRCGLTKACVAGGCACPSGTHDCSGLCARDNSVASCGTRCRPCPPATVAGATATCSNGECGVECVLRTLCNDSCVDTLSDRENCNECGHACGPGEACTLGSCLLCESGLRRCNGACVDTNLDKSNCGGCGMACAPGENCVSGSCACPDGKHRCGTACVDNTSVNSCGTRSNMDCSPCPATTTPPDGEPVCDPSLTCTIRCPTGLVPCNGGCAASC